MTDFSNDKGNALLNVNHPEMSHRLNASPDYAFSKKPVGEILQYLKKHGERLDTEIAVATGISLANVHLHLSHLVARGEVVACRSIKFEKGRQAEGISCRIVGYIPPAAPGRKSRPQFRLSS